MSSKMITALVRDGKYKYRFYIDGEYSFFLTNVELREYGLFSQIKGLLGENDKVEELSVAINEKTLAAVHDETVLNRGKRYALGLLSDRDYTQQGLARKLAQAGYADIDVNLIMEYILGFNYVDDVRYAVNYIKSKEVQKSRKYIENQLSIKGISKPDLQKAFDIVEEEHSQDGVSEKEIVSTAITSVIRRKLKPEDFDNHDKQTKIISSLLRSGYNYSDIKQCLYEYIESSQQL